MITQGILEKTTKINEDELTLELEKIRELHFSYILFIGFMVSWIEKNLPNEERLPYGLKN